MFTDIQIVLSKTDTSSKMDCRLFNLWESKKISTSQCLKHFYKNNKIAERYVITPSHFEHWLNSLGYIRE